MRSNVCAFLAILLSTLAAVRAFAAASLTTLGGLPGSTNSIAYGASGDGTVVVGRNYSSGYEAFRWTNGGGMVGLGDLPGGSFLNSWAKGVSGDGSVVVGVSISASDNEAFRWTSSGGGTRQTARRDRERGQRRQRRWLDGRRLERLL